MKTQSTTFSREHWSLGVVLLIVGVAALLSGCQIRSQNEPKTDAEALKLVGINMVPPPAAVFRRFEAGMDDCMRLVVRFPKSQLSEFWSSSPWRTSTRSQVEAETPSDGVPKILSQLPIGNEPDWKAYASSHQGWWSSAGAGLGRYAMVYAALDRDTTCAVAYIFWHET